MLGKFRVRGWLSAPASPASVLVVVVLLLLTLAVRRLVSLQRLALKGRRHVLRLIQPHRLHDILLVLD